MTPDILITENIGGRWIDELKARFTVVVEPELWKSPDKIKALLPNCRALIVRLRWGWALRSGGYGLGAVAALVS